MSSHRAKRPFAGASADPSQRQITTFFSSASTSSPSPSSRPSLPWSVQANLLNVGMRVRKSVPEGYKTKSTSAFRLWTDNTAPSAAAGARELLPFCGINKIGDLYVQPANDPPPIHDVPGLTLSQESVSSTASSVPSRKRPLTDDDDGHNDDDDRPIQSAIALDGEVSPRSLVPVSWNNTTRVLATPRSILAKGGSHVDQENMAVDEDWEEADFLVLGEGRDMDTSS